MYHKIFVKIQSFIHSFIKQILKNTYCVSGTMALFSGGKTVNKKKKKIIEYGEN